MSVLSDKDILDAITDGTVVIYPFNPKNLKGSSYDVRLGPWYYKSKPMSVVNIWSEKHSKERWGEPLYASTPTPDECEKYDLKPNDRFILLQPGETILTHTEEFIGGRGKITTMMKTRSSLGRSDHDTNMSAGWGDPDYVNRWTMEYRNISPHTPQILIVGERVSQIVFMEMKSHCINGYSGSYQSTNNFDDLMEKWKPDMMIPRLKRDFD